MTYRSQFRISQYKFRNLELGIQKAEFGIVKQYENGKWANWAIAISAMIVHTHLTSNMTELKKA